ncbi:hypothetical protein PPTG_13275 [Phytophthora nicotianae INRA-310]|uniref:Uncharacterized protein n=2 Tax=Phytophthora nicotianae TaxID=4792 RepID=W2Q0V6_PHYN3|nr:hypothetical protein PPTG_13275 [Phytophthora nicotianae INRA-310]ETN05920.1 hypothetical protein PPTG_13275 [Phytophthora nicotianae INRA-310]
MDPIDQTFPLLSDYDAMPDLPSLQVDADDATNPPDWGSVFPGLLLEQFTATDMDRATLWNASPGERALDHLAQALESPLSDVSKAAEDSNSESLPQVIASTLTPEQDTTEASSSSKKRPRVTWKHQIDALREEVAAHTAQLNSLRAQWNPLEFSAGPDGFLIPKRKPLWQQIALRQLERRRKAEEENKQLRRILCDQIQEARSLRRLMKRRSKIKLMEDMFGHKRAPSRLIPTHATLSFGSLINNIDQAYGSFETVFAEKGIPFLPCPGKKRIGRRHLTDGVFLELAERKVVPFSREQTEKAISSSLRRIGTQKIDVNQVIEGQLQFIQHHVGENDDTVTQSFFVSTPQLSRLLGASVRMATRKYVEKDRTVFVCSIYLDPKLGDGKTTGFHTRATLIIVVRQRMSQFAVDGDMSTFDCFFSATRDDRGLPQARAIRSPMSLSVGMDTWESVISSLPGQIESSLVDSLKSN